MRAAVIVFPGSNCDRDMAIALEQAGADVHMVWHKDATLPSGIDFVAIPGGFSYGDYLRCGAIAAKSNIMADVIAHADRGGYVLGVCNGFQVLTESGLLPGALLRNAGLKFVCKQVTLNVQNLTSSYTDSYSAGDTITVPVAHHDGNYRIDEDGLRALQDQDRIAFTYAENPNGSIANIAGVLSENKRVLGMMPHPERAVSAHHTSHDGAPIFANLATALVTG